MANQTAAHQITLSGKDLNEQGEIIPKDLSLNLDDEKGDFGLPISLGVFKKMTGRYIHDHPNENENEKVMFVINKQLLQILLSSEKCKALMVTRCSREPGVNSLAFVAVDESGIPLGLQASSNNQVQDTSKVSFSGAEFVGGSTIAELKHFIDMNESGLHIKGEPIFDLEKFLNSPTYSNLF